MSVAPIDALRVAAIGTPRARVVLLHGYAMCPQDLEPFAHSMKLPAEFHFPRGIVTAPGGAHAWWPIDEERRSAQMSAGPRDLYEEHPLHRPAARAALLQFVAAARSAHPDLPLVLGGFSQGGMLACDTLLVGGADIAGLVMLSSSRIAFDEWTACRARLRGLPVFVSHGNADTDLALAAGENLRDFFVSSGARVTWQAFEGGHEIPLVVWRSLRRFLSELGGERT